MSSTEEILSFNNLKIKRKKLNNDIFSFLIKKYRFVRIIL